MFINEPQASFLTQCCSIKCRKTLRKTELYTFGGHHGTLLYHVEKMRLIQYPCLIIAPMLHSTTMYTSKGRPPNNICLHSLAILFVLLLKIHIYNFACTTIFSVYHKNIVVHAKWKTSIFLQFKHNEDSSPNMIQSICPLLRARRLIELNGLRV